MKDARQKRIDEVHAYAVKAFAEHQVTQTLAEGVFRYWWCAKPDRCEYNFSVTTTPGRLIIAGDIGFLAVERTFNMIAWARSAVNSIGYFAEKVSHEIPTRQYDPEVAKEWCGDFMREVRKEKPDNWKAKIDKVNDLLNSVDDEHWFQQNLYDSCLVDGCDFPDLKNWTHSFLWCREAMMWLLERVGSADDLQGGAE